MLRIDLLTLFPGLFDGFLDDSILKRAIARGLVRSCHDLSEGGLATALAEMALAGDLGARVSLRDVPRDNDAQDDHRLRKPWLLEEPSR